jgi:hypothetical protein
MKAKSLIASPPIVFSVVGAVLAFGSILLSTTPAFAEPEPPIVYTDQSISGKVLPFKVVRAIRNYGYQRGMIEAAVSIAVDPAMAAKGDWYATTAFAAEKSFIRDVTFVQVEVIINNPWGDMPPLLHKKLVTAYFSPIPGMSPWNDRWSFIGVDKAASLTNIAFDVLSNDLMGKYQDRISDPEKLLKKAEDEARRSVIRIYHLSSKWQPDLLWDPGSEVKGRGYVHVMETPEGDYSATALTHCLNADEGGIFRGCMPEQTHQ